MTTPTTFPKGGALGTATLEQLYEHEETRDLVALVNDAADLVLAKGEAAFPELRGEGSRWRNGDSYVFVLDLAGNMIVHADPVLEGKNQIDLKDIGGKYIIRGLIDVATALATKPEGWFHYQWPVPGGLLPRWKSSFVKLVTLPSGKNYIVGSGMYDDRMERAFVVDMVTNAAAEIEKLGRKAFPIFHDPTGPYLVKDAYVFVDTMDGTEIVNPAFPNIEGRNLTEVKDTHGKAVQREILQVAQTQGSGWVDYMWPKPGQSVSTQKSAYVTVARMGDERVVVGCGVYLAEAPVEAPKPGAIDAVELEALVNEAAAMLAERGGRIYGELRKLGSKWYRDDRYFFVWKMDGTRVFHAPDPGMESQDASGAKDVLGRPYGRMIIDAAESRDGEGWVHYMYPMPGNIFPVWKSTYVKRVTFPSGREHIVGCGVYNMRMDRTLIEDVVDRACGLIAQRGRDAFPLLRDRTGPFVFMDTYVFVQTPDGTELVNPAQPSLEGKNLIDLRDVKGLLAVKDEIALALDKGSGWLDCHWFKPGDNVPALKRTYVKKVVAPDGTTYVAGSGIYE